MITRLHEIEQVNIWPYEGVEISIESWWQGEKKFVDGRTEIFRTDGRKFLRRTDGSFSDGRNFFGQTEIFRTDGNVSAF